LGTSPRISRYSQCLALGLALSLVQCLALGVALGLALVCGGASAASADPPAGTDAAASAKSPSSDAQTPVPSGNFLSSLKQAFKQDYDHEVVRGHFDLGSPPDAHRYYCLVDPKTGKNEANGVGGQPVLRPDGMTGIKSGAVSVYSCSDAAQQGILVTAGYVLSAGASSKIAPQPSPPPPSPVQRQAGAPEPNRASPDKIDVAGVKLGMSPDQVRAVLKSKKLHDYHESMETLGHFDSTKGGMQSTAGDRFVNVIAAWTAPSSSRAGDTQGEDGESFEIMFTPVPGKERAMAIVHSTAYSSANAVRETALEHGLVRKYGGFGGSDDLPESPTWRIQNGGNVQVGDPCNRRGIFGGLIEPNMGNTQRPNLALKTALDEFRFQIDRCGVAIVTEDHATTNGGARREDRIVARFTVTAYSPSIGFEGATAAAQLIQAAGEAGDKVNAARTKDQPALNL
jgi:hypothetical protein